MPRVERGAASIGALPRRAHAAGSPASRRRRATRLRSPSSSCGRSRTRRSELPSANHTVSQSRRSWFGLSVLSTWPSRVSRSEEIPWAFRKLLEAVIHRFDGGPVGLDNVAASIGEERDTIEDVIEPYLIQQGYLQRTPRGRIATLAAYRHLGVTPPRPEGGLFDPA